MNFAYNKRYVCILWVTALALVVSDTLTYYLWPQVEFVHLQGLKINLQNVYSNPHTLRYSLVYPVYVLADYTGLDANRLFSLLVVTLLASCALLLANSMKFLNSQIQIERYNTAYYVFLLILSTAMNGRLVFGLLAYSLLVLGLLLYCNQKSPKEVFLAAFIMTLSVLFSSVSSGIALSLYAFLFFSVSFLCLDCFFIQRYKIKFKRAFYIYLALLSIAYAPIIWMLADKNLTYFEGSISNMMNHGSVKDFNIENIFSQMFAFFSILLVCFLVVNFRSILARIDKLLLVFLLFCILVLSSLANSILVMAFIPSLLLISILISDLRVFSLADFNRN